MKWCLSSFLFTVCLLKEAFSDCVPQFDVANGYEDKYIEGKRGLIGATDLQVPGFKKLKCETITIKKSGHDYHLEGDGVVVDSPSGEVIQWKEDGKHKDINGKIHFHTSSGDFTLTVIGFTENAYVLYSCEYPLKVPYVWIYYTNVKGHYVTLPESEQKEIQDILSKHNIEYSSLKYPDNSQC